MNQRTFVIVGASLAGARAALALRGEGFEGRIVLIGEERSLPYERPELSKKYLRGEPGVDLLVEGETAYADAEVELLSGTRVVAIDPRDRNVTLASGSTVGWDRVLLATGSTPRQPTVPGSDLDGIFTLRRIEDADGIRERARRADHVVVAGGGWIGSEVAASLRELGSRVTLVTKAGVPLEHVLGGEVGALYRDAHLEHGVELRPHASIRGFGGSQRVESVELSDGTTIAADMVVMGIGAEPAIELARNAGLAVGSGVLVDADLETSAPGVFAAGDIAEAWHPLYERRIRVEHWDNAKRQGRAAAANMLDLDRRYERIPYFYSDQYDVGMEYTGYAPRWDRVVIRGDAAARRCVCFWLADGRVLAGMNVNVWDVASDVERLVRSRAMVDPARLADPEIPLSELLPTPIRVS